MLKNRISKLEKNGNDKQLQNVAQLTPNEMNVFHETRQLPGRLEGKLSSIVMPVPVFESVEEWEKEAKAQQGKIFAGK